MTMNNKNRSDLGIANSDCSYLRPEALCQNGYCIWVFWWILPTKFHSHSQHEWISPKWLWHMRCPIGTACMGILIKNCVSEICIIIWQVCGAYGVKNHLYTLKNELNLYKNGFLRNFFYYYESCLIISPRSWKIFVFRSSQPKFF